MKAKFSDFAPIKADEFGVKLQNQVHTSMHDLYKKFDTRCKLLEVNFDQKTVITHQMESRLPKANKEVHTIFPTSSIGFR